MESLQFYVKTDKTFGSNNRQRKREIPSGYGACHDDISDRRKKTKIKIKTHTHKEDAVLC